VSDVIVEDVGLGLDNGGTDDFVRVFIVGKVLSVHKSK
jgi:hypothetical protein